jgi:hypothetical protein
MWQREFSDWKPVNGAPRSGDGARCRRASPYPWNLPPVFVRIPGRTSPMSAFGRMPSRRATTPRAGLWLLALVTLAHSIGSASLAWSAPASPRRLASLERPLVEAHERGTCQCRRCAGPSSCPCDHGTAPGGAVMCGAADEDRPIGTEEAPPPAPAKMICDVPLRPSVPEFWMSRTDRAAVPVQAPFAQPVDKVPIAQA